MGGGAGEKGEISGERTRFEIATEERGDRSELGQVEGFLCGDVKGPVEVGDHTFP